MDVAVAKCSNIMKHANLIAVSPYKNKHWRWYWDNYLRQGQFLGGQGEIFPHSWFWCWYRSFVFRCSHYFAYVPNVPMLLHFGSNSCWCKTMIHLQFPVGYCHHISKHWLILSMSLGSHPPRSNTYSQLQPLNCTAEFRIGWFELWDSHLKIPSVRITI